LIGQVLEVYARIDSQIDEFNRSESFRCPPGCGRCCENPDVEATVLEILPLAWHLYESNRAEEIYDRIETENPGSHRACIHYAADPAIGGNGRCTVYEQRPYLCRMFGFSARYDKHGKTMPVFCKQHKSIWPEEIERISQRVQDGVSSLPNYQNLHYELYGIHPDLQSQRFPINIALKKAIEYLYFYRRRPDHAA
tara:strand:+ start:8873 stop:9457 length:585 start_codon:yes stop_codon:yes gene_type:complete